MKNMRVGRGQFSGSQGQGRCPSALVRQELRAAIPDLMPECNDNLTYQTLSE